MKILFIVPYFGKLPSNFDLWLKTCQANPEFNWLIISDQDLPEYPVENVQCVYFKDIAALSKLINAKLNLKVKINSAYKFCDYRPLYGAIFEDYLDGYDFWGFCDMDVFFGRLSNFLIPEILDEYDIIQRWGHLTVVRNNEVCNRLYEKCFGYSTMEKVLNWDMNQGTDERIMPYIGQKSGLKCYYNQTWMADVAPHTFQYKMDKLGSNNYTSQIFAWESGVLYRYFLNNGHIHRDEFMYIHLQKREIEILNKVSGDFMITPNGVYNKTREVNLSDFFSDSTLKERFDVRYKQMMKRLIRMRLLDTFLKGKLVNYLIYKRYLSSLWTNMPDITVTRRETDVVEIVTEEAGMIG